MHFIPADEVVTVGIAGWAPKSQIKLRPD